MISVAVFGGGRMGRIHSENVFRHPRLSLRSISDPDTVAANAIALRFGAKVAQAEEVFSDPDLKAIVIASPAETHPELIRRAAAAGLAVFCEKPIARDIVEVNSCLDALEAAKSDLFLAFNRRFDPSFHALKSRLESGEIGKTEMVVLTSRDPMPPPIAYIAKCGGLFRETMVHDFDVARWLLAEEPTEVYATASCLVDPAIGAAGSPDTAVATLRTASGAICVINNSWRSAYGYDQRAEALGSTGMLAVENTRRTSVVSTNSSGVSHDSPIDFFTSRYSEAYRLELDAFVSQLEGSQGFAPNGTDGLQALVLAECAIRSVRENRPVAIPAPRYLNQRARR